MDKIQDDPNIITSAMEHIYQGGREKVLISMERKFKSLTVRWFTSKKDKKDYK